MNKKVVLFDLDGTLLPMDIEKFTKMYFQGLCKSMIQEVQPDLLINNIWKATKQMILNDGSKTNMEVFQDYYDQHMPVTYAYSEPIFMDFYKNEFQNCIKACNPSDISKDIVMTLMDKGYVVAIATNPIFPQIATYSRLHWLGIDPNIFPLVTTFENSHSAKPNPLYYQEVCSKLNVSPSDCIMIGNDVKEDGIAASLGMEVILVSDCLLNTDNLPVDAFEMKSLAGVLDWAKKINEVD